jgi:hypothetical protein
VCGRNRMWCDMVWVGGWVSGWGLRLGESAWEWDPIRMGVGGVMIAHHPFFIGL